jgi:adenylylsulfate kinase
MKDSKGRSILKTVSWRVLATLTTMTLVYLFTGRVLLSVGVGLVEALTKLALYYLHERIWERIGWGKHPMRAIPIAKTDLTDEDMRIITEKLQELGYL